MDGWIWIEIFHEHLKIDMYICVYVHNCAFYAGNGYIHGSLLKIQKSVQENGGKMWHDTIKMRVLRNS